MYSISYSKQFDKDLKVVAKRGYNTDLLLDVIRKLHELGKLEPRYRSHKLQGEYNNYMECHIKSDWLLIWKQDNNTMKIMLTRTGTHSDLF